MPEPIKKTVEDLLRASTSLIVPFYQRDYEWEVDSQIIPFEYSFTEQATEYPTKGQNSPKPQPLYLGALVLDPRKIGNHEKISGDYRIVDGQQRLVTLNLLLCALRDVMAKSGFDLNNEISKINSLIFQSTDGNSSNPKLIPNVANQNLFKRIIMRSNENNFENIRVSCKDYFKKNSDELKLSIALMPPRMLSAYITFYNSINALVDKLSPATNQDGVSDRLRNYLEGILDAVVIVILLDEKDDTQSFFKSLNSGKPLTSFELVKNDVLMRAENQKTGAGKKCFDQQWIYFEESADAVYWKSESSIAKHKLPNSNWFLYYYLSAVSGLQKIRIDKLVYEYDKFQKNALASDDSKTEGPFKFDTVEEEVAHFVTYAKTFKKMCNKQQSSLGSRTLEPIEFFFQTLRRFKSESQFYPFALRLWNSDLTPEDKTAVFDIIISFMVRRIVLKIPVEGINKMFLEIIRKLDENAWSLQNFIDALLKFKSDSGVFPTNEEFSDHWLTKPSYDDIDSQAIQFILESIEKKLTRTGSEAVISFNSENNSVEHFMPQKWREHWTIRENDSNHQVTEEEFERSKKQLVEDDSLMGKISRRKRLLDNFGNLTILTKNTNSRSSNESFDTKRGIIKNNTTMMMNRELAEKTKWDEDDIVARSKQLFDIAVELWPYPKGL